MNRQNIVWHVALALMLVAAAAFVGQVRRWQNERPPFMETPRAQFDEHERAVPEQAREAGDVLVRFREGVFEGRIREIVESLNDEVDDEIESVGGLVEVHDNDGQAAEDTAAEYAALSEEVEYAEANAVIELDPLDAETREVAEAPAAEAAPGANLPNDPLLGEQWALVNRGQRDGKDAADIGAALAWARTQGSDRVVVAVLDSGVDYTHKDLMDNMWLRPGDIPAYVDDQLGAVDDLHGFNAVENLRDPMDDNGHGTHCAGIIGAVGNNGEGVAGVNWKVEIMPLKFMSSTGAGTTKDAVEAINYVIDRKRAGVNVRIISASWGSTRRSKALEDAIRKAGEAGILFVAASGNSTADTDKRPHYPSSYKLPNVIAVAALNRRDELAGFSNFGAQSVHVAAPGAEILSTWLNDNYREASGTSMATPVVSGVAALVLSVEPNLSVKELRERLLSSVDKLDALNGKVSSGGRINAARAVGAR
jgi:subtilisin family serine protease